MGRRVRIGTERDLASMRQVELLARKIEQLHPQYTAEPVALEKRGKHHGGFDGLMELLGSGRVELAICAMEEVPLATPAGIVRAAVTKRNTPFEALVSKGNRILDDFPPGAKLGVNGHHRKIQFLAYRKDLKICECRGGLESNWRKVSRDQLDGFVVSASDVEWVGWQDKVSEIFTTEVCLPRAGQGSLGIFVRKGDSSSAALARQFDDPESRLEVDTERRFLSTLLPSLVPTTAVLGRVEGELFKLEAAVGKPDQDTLFKTSSKGRAEDTEGVVSILIRKLAEAGASELFTSPVDE